MSFYVKAKGILGKNQQKDRRQKEKTPIDWRKLEGSGVDSDLQPVPIFVLGLCDASDVKDGVQLVLPVFEAHDFRRSVLKGTGERRRPELRALQCLGEGVE